ncbi:MAG: threonylcarbamoyl-AMP synthase [Candidatus Magnetomorum sp.]|nr:threonylcarbamoyl-AMP synthase [Candidatus Magnetomorum sp.]
MMAIDPMQTKIIPVSLQKPDMDIINQAAQLIQSGQLVAFPTETVYGLGADAFNAGAVQTIFSVKQRPSSDPLIVHIQNIRELTSVAINIPDSALELADQYWPGPLTLILEKHPDIPLSVTAGGQTIAVRLPAHPIARLLIQQSCCPIAAPSANRFSRPSPTLAQHVFDDLDARISMIIDGGATDIGLESTVLDLTQSPPCILRPGGIILEDLKSSIPDVHMSTRYLDAQNSTHRSPGQLFKHYAPKARLLLFSGDHTDKILTAMEEQIHHLLKNNKTVGVMVTDENAAFFQNKGGTIMKLGSINDLGTVAKKLFACMRTLDSQSMNYILMKMPPEIGLGWALKDRLIRAAYEIINV